MQIPKTEIGALVGAMERCFDGFELDRLLAERLGLSVERVSTRFKPIGNICLDVVTHFDRRNTVEQLVAALRDARPDEVGFLVLADRAGFSRLPGGQSLEVLIRDARFQDVTSFRSDLAAKEAAVCLVEVGAAAGTGVLVAPDIVLTNHHVVAASIGNDGRPSRTVGCLFDHVQATSGFITPGLRIDVVGILAASPPAEEDEMPSGENIDPEKLDYAMLKLARAIGSEPIVAGFAPRGFVAPSVRPGKLKVGEGVLLLQHPGGGPMKIDIGSLTHLGTTRFRHTANTEPGSSGCPIFDASLDLIGLHHVGADWPASPTPYNQAIPLELIIADARKRGVNI